MVDKAQSDNMTPIGAAPSSRQRSLADEPYWVENLAGFEGREVSCRALGIFFDELPERGLSPDQLAQGTGHSADFLQKKNERISWDAYCRFMDNAAIYWSDAEMVALGQSFFSSPQASPTALIARLLYTPLDFYRIAARPGLRSGRQISCVQPFIQELGEQKILYNIKLHPDYEPCRGFWLITHGVLMAMPTVMGLPPAKVDMTIHAEGAQYLIEMPRGGGWLAWLRRLVAWPFTIRATARELEAANIELQTQYLRLQAQMAQRERAEEAASEARSFLETAIENMRDGFVLIDAEGRLRLYNKQYERLFPRMAGLIKPGAVFSELVRIGAEMGQVHGITGQMGDTYLEERLQAWESGEVYQFKTSEGLWIEARDNVLAGGGRIGLRVDITERMRVAAELEALVAELEDKNSELERFTYTVSHDLKSPLVTVNGFLGFLKQDLAANDRERVLADVARIEEATDQMQALLDDLLELSRIGRVVNPPEAVSFNNLVDDALALVTGRLETSGAQVTVMPDLPVVHVDRRRLVEVLQNLIDNAAKFSAAAAPPQIGIGYDGGGAEPAFFVRDNGIGIAPRHHEQVFGLFDRLDPSIEGTGVGLTLVRRIIQAHGGRVWLESTGAGSGTTVWFTLPAGADR